MHYTKDIDLWIRPSVENAGRIVRAFHRFGVPMVEVSREDFENEGLQYVIGVSPSQIDFLTSLPCPYSFEDAWAAKSVGQVSGIPVYFLGKDELIIAKKVASRPQDLADIDELGRASS